MRSKGKRWQASNPSPAEAGDGEAPSEESNKERREVMSAGSAGHASAGGAGDGTADGAGHGSVSGAGDGTVDGAGHASVDGLGHGAEDSAGHSSHPGSSTMTPGSHSTPSTSPGNG